VEFVRLQLTHPSFPISRNLTWEDNLRRLERYHTSNRKGRELEYRVAINVADAADYGVPQRRHRVFFVGFRADVEARWFFPSPTHSHEDLIRDQFVTGDYWKSRNLIQPKSVPKSIEGRVRKFVALPSLPMTAPWRTVRDAVVGLGDPRLANDFDGHFFQDGARSYPGHTGSPLDEPSKALKAGDHGVPGGENMMRKPNGKVRYFSVRESARIQTFPDEWKYYGSWTESMRQLGNAVPVDLGFAVARSVAAHMMPHGRGQRLQSAR